MHGGVILFRGTGAPGHNEGSPSYTTTLGLTVSPVELAQPHAE